VGLIALWCFEKTGPTDNRESSERLAGHRRVVERTLPWTDRYRQLKVR
jgi:hypothetical protein